jgi:2-polyprenyl-3-methyl-5-hydroxy-6-metoxy-1,4-benzoquinol methylase
MLGTLPKTLGLELSRPSFTLMSCDACDLNYLTPLPTEADFKAEYVDADVFTGPSYRGDERTEQVLRFYTSRYRRLLSMTSRDRARPMKVLEIGAGLAWVCRVVKMEDPDAFTLAQDVTNKVAHECRDWVDRYIVDLNVLHRAIALHAPYDLISMTHVIEHLPDPVQMLHDLRRLLAPDGFIYVTAPHRPENWSASSPLTDWIRWSYNHVPGHLQYLSETALKKCAQQTGMHIASFEIMEKGQSFEGVFRQPLPSSAKPGG